MASHPTMVNMAGPTMIRLVEDSQHEYDDNDRMSYWLTDTRLLCFVAGSMLLTASLLFFPNVLTMVSGAGAPALFSSFTSSADSDSFMPLLLEDLTRQGLFKPEDRAVFLENPTSAGRRLSFVDRTVDFILASDGSGTPDFVLADRALKVGGIIAVQLGEEPFNMPPNYRLVYVQRFGSTVVAMRKIAHTESNVGVSGAGRRLLTLPKAKKRAPDGMEDVLLEPPRKKAAYIPWQHRSLDQHAKLVFVDVGPQRRVRSEDWFKKHYPAARRQQEFEVVRLNVEEAGEMGGSEGITEWLARNVREEEYVVMKAEAEVAEEMVREGGIGLVDELFLECSHQWEKGRKGVRRSRRAYWECLALYGKLRDVGVAVHQWWG